MSAFGPATAGYRRQGLGLQRMVQTACLLLSLVLAGWMGFKWHQDFRTATDLEMSVVSHVMDELDHLEIDKDVGPQILRFLLSEFGARIDGDLGHVRYAGRCAIGRHFGIHMVVPGQEGPVTVLIMPGKNLLQPRPVRSSRFSGVIVPAGSGSMAVVGEKMEPVERVLERLQRSIVWGA